MASRTERLYRYVGPKAIRSRAFQPSTFSPLEGESIRL
jgi:hypothetical protein